MRKHLPRQGQIGRVHLATEKSKSKVWKARRRGAQRIWVRCAWRFRLQGHLWLCYISFLDRKRIPVLFLEENLHVHLLCGSPEPQEDRAGGSATGCTSHTLSLVAAVSNFCKKGILTMQLRRGGWMHVCVCIFIYINHSICFGSTDWIPK